MTLLVPRIARKESAERRLSRYCDERGWTWRWKTAAFPYKPIELSVHSPIDIQGDVLLRVNGWSTENACSRTLERLGAPA